jgi:tRNA (cmo5U34)-methyltransferase
VTDTAKHAPRPEPRRDTVKPDGPWQFDHEVTEAFDDMLARSIPQYEVMRDAVTNLACRYLPDENQWLVDLGCSRGEAIQRVLDRKGIRNNYIGVEISEPMHVAATERFKGWPNVDIRKLDLREFYPQEPAAVTLAVLTLQFTPIEYRPRLVERIHSCTKGAAIIVEKVIGQTAELDELFVDLYLDSKRAAGYSEDEIIRKRLALEGVLVPVTREWNEQLLRRAGFRQVECFWSWMNFCGWIAIP